MSEFTLTDKHKKLRFKKKLKLGNRYCAKHDAAIVIGNKCFICLDETGDRPSFTFKWDGVQVYRDDNEQN